MNIYKGSIAYRELPDEWKKVSKWMALVHILLIWAAIAGVVFCHDLYQGLPLYFLTILVLGGLQNNLNSLVHHSIHGNIHPNKYVNNFITRVFVAGPIGQIFGRLKSEHLSHHANFGDDDDPERFYYDLKLHRRRSKYGLLRWTVCVFLGWVLYPMVLRLLTGDRSGAAKHGNDSKTKKGRDNPYLDVLAVMGAQGVLFLGFYLLTNNIWSYVMYWVVPLSTFGAAFTALRATIEHANIEDPDHLLISIKSNIVEKFFFGPLNFNYHYEHHRFMNIPYYYVPKVRKFLREKEDYNDVLFVDSYIGRLAYLIRGSKTRAASVCGKAEAGSGDPLGPEPGATDQSHGASLPAPGLEVCSRRSPGSRMDE